MSIESILILVVVGVIAGWLAGRLVKGRGFGLVGNMLLGIVGAFLGGWLFAEFRIVAPGIVGTVIAATVGASVVLLLTRIVKRI
jgi:uncharacterized membrane protein YeaQ/YmgE (transglycosylase-associated protein family)